MNLGWGCDVETHNDTCHLWLGAGFCRGFVKSFTKNLRRKMEVVIVE